MKVFFCLGLSVALLAGCGGSGDSKSDACTSGVNACNAIPIANAGAAQKVLVGTKVALDGSGSSDANNDPLTYSWSILQRPAGSTANLVSPTSAKATFEPDGVGAYVVTLTVFDGKSSSTVSTTTVTASATNLTVSSTSYADGGTIPLRIAGSSNLFPQLTISDIPNGTKGFAIFMEDSSGACTGGITACRFWTVFNIPASKTAIAEGENLLTQTNVVYTSNYPGSVGYSGVIAPGAGRGPHTYNLTVYALTDNFIPASGTLTLNKSDLKYGPLVIGKATLTGYFDAP